VSDALEEGGAKRRMQLKPLFLAAVTAITSVPPNGGRCGGRAVARMRGTRMAQAAAESSA